MKNYKKQPIRIKIRNSNRMISNDLAKELSIHNQYIHDLDNKYDGNIFWAALNQFFQSPEDRLANPIDQKEILEILYTYETIVSPDKSYHVDLFDIKDAKTYHDMLFYEFYKKFARFRMNLAIIEEENPHMKGFNEFLLKVSPKQYNAYFELTNRYGFFSSMLLLREDNQEIANPKDDQINDKFLKEIDESPMNPSLINLQGCMKSSDALPTSNLETTFLHPFYYMVEGLNPKKPKFVKQIDSNLITDINMSYCSLMGSKCTMVSLYSGGKAFQLGEVKDFVDKKELVIVASLAEILCFRINLEFLELKNPELKGLNEFLSNRYPKTYNAYCALSKQYGFDRTVKLELKPSPSLKEFETFLRDMIPEKWICN